jgi:hypothetical protein
MGGYDLLGSSLDCEIILSHLLCSNARLDRWLLGQLLLFFIIILLVAEGPLVFQVLLV